MPQQTTVGASIPRISRAYAVYGAWVGLALLSFCLSLPALVVSTLWCQLLFDLIRLFWLNDPTIGSAGDTVVTAFLLGSLLVGSLISLVQGFVLQRELHVPIRRWGAWVMWTTLGWSSGLVSIVLIRMSVDRSLHQTPDTPFVALLTSGLIGGAVGLFVGILQWFVLRRAFGHARLWILATMIGWIIGGILLWGVQSALNSYFSNWSIS